MPAAAKTVFDRIKHLRPCDEAREWAKKQTSPTKAWKACVRGDWLLWIIGKCAGKPESDARKKLMLCCCEVARTTLKYTKDPRVLACIETAERWARGEATIEQLREARNAAAAAYAANAAANVADVAANAAAAYAANAAANVADVAANAAYYADRAKSLAESADIVRQHYPKPPKI